MLPIDCKNFISIAIHERANLYEINEANYLLSTKQALLKALNYLLS